MSDPVCECGHTRESHRYESPSPGGWRNCYLCGCEDFRAAGAAKGPTPPDLLALMQRLAADPRDALTVQALADWVEERAGDCKPLRELWVEGGDVIVLGLPSNMPPAVVATYAAAANKLEDWFVRKGREVVVMTMDAAVTIRQIKLAAAPAEV